MPEKVISDFIGGLNLLLAPTKIRDNQCQVLQNFEVRPVNIANNLTYAALTTRFSYSRLHTDNLSFIPYNLVEFVVHGIGSLTYASGTGGSLNDATVTGAFTGTQIGATYVITIDSTGATDTFAVTINGSAVSSGTEITGSTQSIGNGLEVEFGTITGHVTNDTWSFNVTEDGTRYLVAAGYATSGSSVVVKSLQDGQTTMTTISCQAVSNSSFVSFLLFGRYLYHTNGNYAWRRWDGLNDVASGFTTQTRYAVKHKNRAVYLYDVTNNRPDRIWVSNVGDAETVGSGNNFTIGEFSDGLIIGIDQTERLILVKQKSTYGFYLAPTLSDSSILKGDDFKGSETPLGTIWGPFGTFLYNGVHGIQSVSGLYVVPTVLQIANQLKGFQNPLAALGFKDDSLMITTLSSSGQSYNNRLYFVNLLEGDENQKVYQWNTNFAAFCQNQGTLTFDGKFKVLEYDGTNSYICELDQIASTAEASFDCVMQTKDFIQPEGEYLPRAQVIKNVTLEFIAPNTTNAITVDVIADGSSVQSASFTPTATGYNRRVFKFNPHTCRGYRISFQISYTQPSDDSIRFAVLGMSYEFDLEPRADN